MPFILPGRLKSYSPSPKILPPPGKSFLTATPDTRRLTQGSLRAHSPRRFFYTTNTRKQKDGEMRIPSLRDPGADQRVAPRDSPARQPLGGTQNVLFPVCGSSVRSASQAGAEDSQPNPVPLPHPHLGTLLGQLLVWQWLVVLVDLAQTWSQAAGPCFMSSAKG